MARTSITAALSSFVTGAPTAIPKQGRRATMRDSLRGSARVDNVGVREQNVNGSVNTQVVSRAWQQEVWSYYDCLDETTEILTIAGWKTHDQIVPGTLVRTLNTETGLAGWEPVEEVRRFEVEDETLYSVESQRFSALATHHHRWPVMHKVWDRDWARRIGVEPRWTTSSEFNPSEDMIRAAACGSDIPTEPKWSDDIVELVAWLWTEGTIRESPRGTSRSGVIYQSQTANPRYVERIRAALQRLVGDPQDLWLASRKGIAAWREILEPSGMVKFRLNAPLLALIEEHAPAKIVARDFILTLTSAQLELFISVSMMADGHLPTRTISQKYPEMLDGLELALILAGYSPNRRTCKTTGKALLSYSEDPVASARTWNKVQYTGTIWCPKTPSQTWLARRRGTVYYTGNTVGEVKYAGNFIGACLSRCTLTVGLRDSKGNIGPCFDENGDPLRDENGDLLPGLERAEEARDLIAALKTDVGGQSQLMRMIGLNLAIAGEFHLVGSGASDTSNMTPVIGEIQQWEVLSTDEFRPKGENYERRSMPGATPQEILGDSVHVVRIWKSHPRWSELPDSSMQAVRDVLEELVLLTREVRGDALSRISNGKVMLVPDEIEWPNDEAEDGSSEAGDSFTRDLTLTMSTAITDKGSAAAVVPFIIRGPADLLDKIRTIDLSRTNASESSAKRIESVQRFAQGIDLPVEITTGHSGTSFANAVVIDDATYKVHIEPVLEIAVDGLTSGYLHPAMDRPGMDPTPLVVFYDSTELVSRPNRSADAKDLHDRFAVSNATLRTSAGFSESDKPDEDEILQRVKLKQLSNIRQTIPAPGQLDTEDENAAQGDPGGTSTLTPPGTPAAPGADIPQGQSTATDTLAASINAVAQVSVERAVRRAGARLRSKSAKTMAVRDLLSQVPDAEVAATLGPEQLGKITGNEDLLRGEFDVLQSWALRETGDPAFAQKLHDACIVITNQRLYSPRAPFPFEQLPRPNG